MNKTNKFLQSYSHIVSAIIIGTYGLFLRFRYRHKVDLQTDELYQVRQITENLHQFFSEYSKMDVCAYLNIDYIVTYFAYLFWGNNKWGLATPHIIMTFLTFVGLYFICKKYYQSALSTIICFLVFSLNATLIHHAFEIRFYPVLVMFSVLLFYFFSNLFESIYQRRWQWISIALLTILTILYQPLGVFIVFFLTLFFITTHFSHLKTNPQLIKKLLLFFGSVAVITFPIWIISVLDDTIPPIIRAPFAYIANPFEDPISFLRTVAGTSIGFKHFIYSSFLFRLHSS